jgi:hypothetical protein
MSPKALDEESRSLSSKNSSATDKTSTAHASDAQSSELAQQETKLVKRSKALVLFVLLAAAAGLGAGKLLLALK